MEMNLKLPAKEAKTSPRVSYPKNVAIYLRHVIANLSKLNYFPMRKVARATALNGESRMPRASPSSIHETEDYRNWPFDHKDPHDVWTSLKNRSETYQLEAVEDCLMDPVVQKFRVGFGWDREAAAGASVMLFDAHWMLADTISNLHRESRCQSVRHSVNNCTAAPADDKESISIDLSNLRRHIHYLLFVVRPDDPCLSDENDASLQVRMTNEEMKDVFAEREMFNYKLVANSGSFTIAGVLSRQGPLWNFKMLRIPVIGQTTEELIQNEEILRFVREIPSWTADKRRISIRVRGAKNLAAENNAGDSSRMAKFDLYYVIQFKDETFQSDHTSQSLVPKWESPLFDMGLVTEAEAKPLKVTMFKSNPSMDDEFMGMIVIPGSDIFRLGPGRHTFWFLLGDGEKKTTKQISGHVLVDIIVVPE